jgi:GDP-L-fucose synthase
VQSKKIFVCGHLGMVGSAINRALLANGHLAQDIVTKTRAELDLCDQAAVAAFFEEERPDQVYLAAAKVGGIFANNTYPADFMYENIMIQTNVIRSAFQAGVRRLLFLGSSCIYPKLAAQPMPETALLTGLLEETNEPYAIAKIAGIKFCESLNRQYGNSHGVDYRCVMPTNLYGPGDNYHSENSHVIPGLIKRFHDAKIAGAHDVKVWGSGNARREFLHVDDLASACLHVMNLSRSMYLDNTSPQCSHVNIGSEKDITIASLAHIIKEVVGFAGNVLFDRDMPDGAPRKLMDSSLLRSLGWTPAITLEDGLRHAYEDFLSENRRK